MNNKKLSDEQKIYLEKGQQVMLPYEETGFVEGVLPDGLIAVNDKDGNRIDDFLPEYIRPCMSEDGWVLCKKMEK